MTESQKKIKRFIDSHKKATGKQLTSFLKVSRQALNKQMASLVENNLVIKVGSRKNVYYLPAGAKTEKNEINTSYKLTGLEEDSVFEQISLKLNIQTGIKKNVLDILRFSFTEMLNNAIDHSQSKSCDIIFRITPYFYTFIIRDFGIGIFSSISSKFRLHDEFAALQDLLKGRTTTMKERHSGEGIFFTSRASDLFTIRSHKILYQYAGKTDQPSIGQMRAIKGTEITFQIRKNSKKNLSHIFREFAPEEYNYRFEKTRVFIKLYQINPVSRSEARRLLFGLNKFLEIEMDFSGVHSIGQGFADEVFRVFQSQNPMIRIVPKNANPVIQTMIQHVVDN